MNSMPTACDALGRRWNRLPDRCCARSAALACAPARSVRPRCWQVEQHDCATSRRSAGWDRHRQRRDDQGQRAAQQQVVKAIRRGQHAARHRAAHPPTFSTTSGWPSAFCVSTSTWRATKSDGRRPPGHDQVDRTRGPGLRQCAGRGQGQMPGASQTNEGIAGRSRFGGEPRHFDTGCGWVTGRRRFRDNQWLSLRQSLHPVAHGCTTLVAVITQHPVAADRLPSVAGGGDQSMRLLEDQPARLLIRRPRIGRMLTALLARARVIGRQVALAREDLQLASQGDTGTLRVDLTPFLHFTALGETFQWFRQRFTGRCRCSSSRPGATGAAPAARRHAGYRRRRRRCRRDPGPGVRRPPPVAGAAATWCAPDIRCWTNQTPGPLRSNGWRSVGHQPCSPPLAWRRPARRGLRDAGRDVLPTRTRSACSQDPAGGPRRAASSRCQ